MMALASPLNAILLGRQLKIRFLTSWNNNNYNTIYKKTQHHHHQNNISNTTTYNHHSTPFVLNKNHLCRSFLHSRTLPLMTNPQAASDPPPSSPIKTVRVIIKGRVQGVFYRNWTVESATQLGLNGWVRNRRDRSVEAVFSGKPDAVQEMEQRCRQGPPDAMVTGLEVFPSDEDPGTGFERRPTV